MHDPVSGWSGAILTRNRCSRLTVPWHLRESRFRPRGVAGQGALTVPNFSNNVGSSMQDAITNVLEKIQAALASNSDCSSWLQGAGALISTALSNNFYGYGVFLPRWRAELYDVRLFGCKKSRWNTCI